jgi:hypothetical protein
MEELASIPDAKAHNRYAMLMIDAAATAIKGRRRARMPGGGISLDGTRWVPCSPDFLVHVKVLARLFRGKSQPTGSTRHVAYIRLEERGGHRFGGNMLTKV